MMTGETGGEDTSAMMTGETGAEDTSPPMTGETGAEDTSAAMTGETGSATVQESESVERPSDQGTISPETHTETPDEGKQMEEQTIESVEPEPEKRKKVKNIDAGSWGDVIKSDEDPSLEEEFTTGSSGATGSSSGATGSSSGATGSTASSGSSGATGMDSEPVEDIIENIDEHAAGDEPTGPAAPEDGSASGVMAQAETEREHYVASLREQMKTL